MAVERDRPYAQFNFLVDLGTGVTDGPHPGFQECSNVGVEVTAAEYPMRKMKENPVQKITGIKSTS
jgi:hypothetical protein